MSEGAARRDGPETYIPRGEEHGRLIDLVDVLASRGVHIESQPALVTADGARYELPEDVASAFERIVRLLSEGQGVTVLPHQKLLTTQEAADLLNISRPTFVKLLERGELAYEMRGKHRRVRLEDVLDYQRSVRSARAVALDEMQHDEQENDLEALLDGPIPTTR